MHTQSGRTESATSCLCYFVADAKGGIGKFRLLQLTVFIQPIGGQTRPAASCFAARVADSNTRFKSLSFRSRSHFTSMSGHLQPREPLIFVIY